MQSQLLEGALTFFHLTPSERTSLKENQIHPEDPKSQQAFSFPHKSHLHA